MPHEIPILIPDQASFRDTYVRKLQKAFQGLTPGIIEFIYDRGYFDNTAIADALSRGEALHPDHVTLTGLQMTIHGSEKLATTGDYQAMVEVAMGAFLDGLDGALARHLGLASPEGAMKDVFADRIADDYMARLIENTKSKHEGRRADMSELRIAFLLSTLTKAASEILGVYTSEGGEGSMIERRKTLLFILYKLGKINSDATLSDVSKKDILSEVDNLTNSLINSSKRRAVERIDQIMEALPFARSQWNTPLLDYPASSVATEVRKYAGVVRMSQRKGLDVVGYLNNLAYSREVFPSWEGLSQRYGYINESIEKTEPFLEAALSLAHPTG